MKFDKINDFNLYILWKVSELNILFIEIVFSLCKRGVFWFCFPIGFMLSEMIFVRLFLTTFEQLSLLHSHCVLSLSLSPPLSLSLSLSPIRRVNKNVVPNLIETCYSWEIWEFISFQIFHIVVSQIRLKEDINIFENLPKLHIWITCSSIF